MAAAGGAGAGAGTAPVASALPPHLAPRRRPKIAKLSLKRATQSSHSLASEASQLQQPWTPQSTGGEMKNRFRDSARSLSTVMSSFRSVVNSCGNALCFARCTSHLSLTKLWLCVDMFHRRVVLHPFPPCLATLLCASRRPTAKPLWCWLPRGETPSAGWRLALDSVKMP